MGFMALLIYQYLRDLSTLDAGMVNTEHARI